MDRISGLSDELLVNILLLVPTKVAVSTSVLSKRWEFLWMWLPKLKYGRIRFSDSRCGSFSDSKCKSLECFLNKNLPLHRAPVLESLCLDLTCAHFNPKDIRMWTVFAISRCARKLDIRYCSSPDNPNILPSNLYTCKSLVILKLDGEIFLDVPRMVCLPSLKTLSLQMVRYSNAGSLQRLLSNCPILEDLTVFLLYGGTTGKLTIVVPSLLSLSLYIPCDHDIEGFVIEAPCLKDLKLIDHYRKNHYCVIDNMPDLIEAYVDVSSRNIKSLIRSITSVKDLTICSKARYGKGIVFNQLKHLELCRCKEHSSAKLLVRLLKDSPNLQDLDITVMDSHEFGHVKFNWNPPRTVPKCVLSSLETLDLWEYDGEQKERDFVVYILQNAVHLKTARIEPLEGLPKYEMLKKLANSSRASTTCELKFD